MPPKGPSSNFAAAANVLFQSAQKVGAVLPLDNSGKQYAMQLKRIQNQSKKRGGSLGSVSYRVAEFLATQKPTTTQKPHRQTAYNTVLKKVPLISIPKLNQPIHSDDDAKKESAATARESFFSPKTQINVPTHGVVDATPASSADSPTADQTSDDAAEPQSPSLDDLVLEDKPLFELNLVPKESKISEQHVISQQVHVAEAAPRLTPKVTIPSATPSSLSVGSGTTMFQEKLQTPAATTISVDSWELQREKEIERIKQRQQEAEQRRLQALRDEEHRSLGNEWVKQRTVHVGKSDDGITSALQEVYRSETVIDALRNFELLTQDRASTPSMVSLAAIFICIKIRRLPPIDSAEQTAAFLSVLQGCKVPQPVIAKVKLRLLRGDAFLEVYDSLPPTDSSRYHPAFASSAVALNMRQGKWEHAIELIQSTRSRIQDKTGHLYIRLLRSLPRSVSEDVRKEVISFVTQSIKGSESTSKELRFAMAQAETGATRRSALMQLTSSGDADERVYAELIVRSTPDSTAKILADMEKQGLSIEDPSVLHAILLKVATGEDPMRAFDEIERQEGIIGIRPMHAATAITAARKLGTVEGHKMAMAVMIRGLPFSRHSLGKILPSLYELNMFEEIAQLSDVYSKHIPIVSALPRGVAFINEALRNLNREPLNSVMLKDIQFVPTGSTASSTIASAEVRAAEVDAAALTEKMLSFAKEKNWPSALEMLQSQPKLGTTDASTTLLYNCGLSAAVESPEAVQIIYQLMKEREVTPNATTVNTVLSSLSRSDTWKEAVDFFNDISPNLRDPNTYLVQLSLLGKHDLHQEASAVFDELRRKYSRPSASMFTLAINATAKHDWSTTLSIFQDMLKIHGAAVKDGVINQVVRCLEQHNRHVELAKLEKDIQKRRKKKK